MIEDEKPQGLGIKRRLIFATIITVLCSAISGLLTLVWAQLPIGGYTGLAIILLIGIII